MNAPGPLPTPAVPPDVVQRFRVVPAAYVMFLRTAAGRTEALLQLRQGTGYMDGYWALAVAGHVERGESVLAAACREAAEEIGVTVGPHDLEPLTTLHRTGGTGLAIDERVDFFFACRRWAGEPRTMEPHKSADLRWFALDDLPEPVVPHEHSVLRAVAAGPLPAITPWGFAPDPPGSGDG